MNIEKKAENFFKGKVIDGFKTKVLTFFKIKGNSEEYRWTFVGIWKICKEAVGNATWNEAKRDE